MYWGPGALGVVFPPESLNAKEMDVGTPLSDTFKALPLMSRKYCFLAACDRSEI